MPYRSLAQERWAHTAAGTKALGGPEKVAEWDQATKGRRLPKRVKSAEARRATIVRAIDRVRTTR